VWVIILYRSKDGDTCFNHGVKFEKLGATGGRIWGAVELTTDRIEVCGIQVR